MIPKLPDELKGKIMGKAGGNLENQRAWTPEEINWTIELRKKGFSAKEIAISLDRTLPSVKLKLKRLTIKERTYNKDHIEEKYKLNKEFLEIIKPKTILDLYAGKESYYKDYNVVSNDIEPETNTLYHEDALKLICKLYSENNKYDLIDLDPFR